MPFLGGWIGYTYAPEKVVEVERLITQGVVKTNVIEVYDTTEYPAVRYGSFAEVNPEAYNIENFEFKPAQNRAVADSVFLIPLSARKVSDNRFLLTIDDVRALELGGGIRAPYATVIYDIVENRIISQVDYPWFASEVWLGLGTQVVIEKNDQDKDQIVLRDYVNDRTEVLYTETEEKVSLYDVCEIGCKASLYVTTDASLIFSRHKQIKSTTATQLLEVKSLKIPDGYLDENQRMYRDGVFEF